MLVAGRPSRLQNEGSTSKLAFMRYLSPAFDLKWLALEVGKTCDFACTQFHDAAELPLQIHNANTLLGTSNLAAVMTQIRGSARPMKADDTIRMVGRLTAPKNTKKMPPILP
jgi:hypothetical protein